MTVNGYTEEEENDEAILVVSSLGDPDGERTRVIANRSAADPGAFVTLADLRALPRRLSDEEVRMPQPAFDDLDLVLKTMATTIVENADALRAARRGRRRR